MSNICLQIMDFIFPRILFIESFWPRKFVNSDESRLLISHLKINQITQYIFFK